MTFKKVILKVLCNSYCRLNENVKILYYSSFNMYYNMCFFCNWRTAGLYADMDFKEGELVLKDPML